MNVALPTLARSSRWRLATLFALYVAQGAPEGLLYVALPAWLAARGVSAQAIGHYVGVLMLPWSFKLVYGLLMDRFAYLPMGRRRPWIVLAQSCLALTLLVLAWRAPAPLEMYALCTIGFAVNAAAALQDVAIDGMAVDLLHDDERERANGLMWGGKALGVAASAWGSGSLLARDRLAAAALGLAAFVAAVMCLPLLLRERPGEKLLPWLAGAARTERAHTARWGSLLCALRESLWQRARLIFAAAVFVALVGYGLHTALTPVLAVKDLHWSQQGYTKLAGLADFGGGLFGLVLAGPIAARLGARCALIGSLLVLALMHVVLRACAGQWQAPWLIGGYIVVYQLAAVQMSIALYALAMQLTDTHVAATQFSLYMALVNLGTSAGARALGPLRARYDVTGVVLVIALVCLLSATLLATLRGQAESPRGSGEAGPNERPRGSGEAEPE